MRSKSFLCLGVVLVGCNSTPPSVVNNRGGFLGNSGGAVVGGSTPSESPESTPSTTDAGRLMDIAVQKDLAGQHHRDVFNTTYAALAAADKQTLDGLVQQASSDTERIMILKSFAAGETMANVVAFANDIRGKDEEEILAGSTMRSEDTLIQQYQQTCGFAMVQVASSEYDPRYAWEMHKLGDVHAVNPGGPVAAQQLQWLHEYGGTESPRGVDGGKEVGIIGILNEKLGAFVRCTFTCETTPDVDGALQAIASQAKAGFPVPIRVAFAGDVGHFMLVEGVKEDGQPQYRVYDPYYGKVRWMTADAFKAGDLVPDNGNKAYLTHWYRSAPK